MSSILNSNSVAWTQFMRSKRNEITTALVESLNLSGGSGGNINPEFQNVTISNNLVVINDSLLNDLALSGTLDVEGNSIFNGDVTIHGTLTTTTSITEEVIHNTDVHYTVAQSFEENVSMYKDLTICGNVTGLGDLSLNNDLVVLGKTRVDDLSATGNFEVTNGTSYFNGNVTISGILDATTISGIVSGGSQDISSVLTEGNNANDLNLINLGKLSIGGTDTTNDLTVVGTSYFNGNVTISGILDATTISGIGGVPSLSQVLAVGNSSSTNNIILNGSANGLSIGSGSGLIGVLGTTYSFATDRRMLTSSALTLTGNTLPVTDLIEINSYSNTLSPGISRMIRIRTGAGSTDNTGAKIYNGTYIGQRGNGDFLPAGSGAIVQLGHTTDMRTVSISTMNTINTSYTTTTGLQYTCNDSNVGTMRFPFLTTNGGLELINSNGTLNVSSDMRLKTDISYATALSGVNAVKSINPAYYKFIGDETQNIHLGFIAQDIEDIVPEAVDGKQHHYHFAYDISGEYPNHEYILRKDAEGNPVYDLSRPRYRGLSDKSLIAVLWKAVQELTARVEALEGGVI